jgi:TPR repeat protein
MPDPVPPHPPRQQRREQHDNNNAGNVHVNVNVNNRFAKWILIGVLGGLALFLQVTVWTIELHLEEKQLQVAVAAVTASARSRGNKGLKRILHADGDDEDNEDNDSDSEDEDDKVMAAAAHYDRDLKKAEKEQRTVRYSTPLDRKELHLERIKSDQAHTGSSVVTAANAYWNQAASLLLRDWDAMIHYDADSQDLLSWSSASLAALTSSENALGNATAVGLVALQRAAELGHPEAQYMVANALAAGFWPMVAQQPDSNRMDKNVDHSLLVSLQVHDHWNPVDSQQHQQLAQAYLYWRMAAVSGHVEAAMTLAHRLDPAYASANAAAAAAASSSGSSINGALSVVTATNPGAAFASSGSKRLAQDKCWTRVFYYRAAADGIVDELESDPHSRAKVIPPMDKHLLHHVHLHGGTGSKLDYFNKPDESQEALQYYHVKATAGMGGEGPSQDAAYTLGKLHHYGLRGVQQNLTLAVQYYEMAAMQGDWEAAGKAGELYLWGMGVTQDAYAAHRMFRIGMPMGLEGCQNKYRQKLKNNKNDQVTVYTCDDGCLNGMGLLKVLGLPMILSVDHEDAEDLFQLARDQGNKDAAYNLAMMKLGWQTHFRKISAMPDGGVSAVDEGEIGPVNHPSRSDYQSILTDLTTAATKGHLQARHRLAMLYTEGVKIPAQAGISHVVKDGLVQVVARDCDKALKHYKGIVDNASPQRSRRLRKAYKQYVAGETANSLRNYLAAAEAGSDLAQTNAAFLMERGECLGLSRIDCAKASVRLWKAAAIKGSDEASLRVGDFYYYGRFREDSKPVGPFGWTQYLLYPEEFLPQLWQNLVAVANGGASESAEDTISSDESERKLEEDLKMSAEYYRLAADKSSSPRANYNLGFLYEWGLGLKQDFPLAKRHYDLSVSGHSQEAEFPIFVARFVMNIHEFVVKTLRSTNRGSAADSKEPSPTKAGASKAGHPVPPSRVPGKTKTSVILSHILSWESLLVLMLTIVLWVLLNHRQTLR